MFINTKTNDSLRWQRKENQRSNRSRTEFRISNLSSTGTLFVFGSFDKFSKQTFSSCFQPELSDVDVRADVHLTPEEIDVDLSSGSPIEQINFSQLKAKLNGVIHCIGTFVFSTRTKRRLDAFDRCSSSRKLSKWFTVIRIEFTFECCSTNKSNPKSE